MKVLLVLNELVTGGAEIFTLRLAAGLQSRGHQVTLLTLRGEASEPHLLHRLWPGGQAIHYRHPLLPLILKLDGLLYRFQFDQSFLRVFQIRFTRRTLNRLKPDLVHSHLYSADLIVGTALEGSTLPWVTTIHGDYLQFSSSCHSSGSQVHRFPSRCARIDRRVNQVVMVSEPQRIVMAELFPISYAAGQHRLIINGLPLPSIHPLPATTRMESRRRLGLNPKGFLIGMVARGIAEKGWDVLIRAFRLAGLADAELLLIGEGPAMGQLATRNASKHIHFIGRTADTLSLIRLCDLTCLPSRYSSESCPLVVAESLAVGVPVIGTRVGQISWMVDEHTDKPAGLTLPLTDTDALSTALADQLRQLHAHPEQLQNWQRNCAQARQKFSMDRCVQDYMETYRAAAT